MADQPPEASRDGQTLRDPAPTRAHGSQRTLVIVLALVLGVGVGLAVWLFRDTGPDSSGSAGRTPSAPSTASPGAAGASPSTTARSPQPIPTQAPGFQESVSILRVDMVSATCEGTIGYDSQSYPVSLAAAGLIDGRSDTAWRCTERIDSDPRTWDPAKGRAIGETVTLLFDQPVRVVGARFIPGYTKVDAFNGANRYTENGRPTVVEWRFGGGPPIRQDVAPKPPGSTPDCDGAEASCVLGPGWWSDEAFNPDPQSPVNSVSFTILAIVPGSDATLANSAAVSEIEVLGYP